MLSTALLSPRLSPEYCEAVQGALASPHARIVPFFGSFLRRLRDVLKGTPSLVVLSPQDAQLQVGLSLVKCSSFPACGSVICENGDKFFTDECVVGRVSWKRGVLHKKKKAMIE